jgi:P-type Cu+ transporter
MYIQQNLVFAFAYNLLAIPVATGMLIPVIGFTPDRMIAAAAMSVSSVAVIAKALRLRTLQL